MRARPPYPCDHVANKLLVTVLAFNLDYEVEPLFVSAALYDAKEKKKISENFYFDFNSPKMKDLLSTHIPYEDASTHSKAACFNVTQATQDLFLVVRVEKVLQACDISEACEPYLKDDKTREKAVSSAGEWCERLGAYRMPLAWTMIDIAKVISGANSLSRCESGVLSAAELTDTDSLMSVSTAASDRFSQSGSMRRVGSGSQFRHSSTNPNIKAMTKEREMMDCTAFSLLQPVVVTSNTFFRQEVDRLSDEDLFKLLAESRKSSTLAKKLKCIPGMLRLELGSCPDDLANRLSGELLRLEPCVQGTNHFVKDTVEFPLRDVFTPNYSYRNLLYVYPKSLNLSSRPGSGGRNLAVKIELVEAESRALPVMYGKSGGPQLNTFAYCSVLYHNKCPTFHDEIKLNIPIDLNETHHLLFTVYHVTCKDKVDTAKAHNDTPIAYTWIPLIRDGRLQTGDFNLPAALDTLPHSYYYMSPQVAMPNLKWVDNHRPVLSVHVCAVSTVHSGDVHIDAFTRVYHWLKHGGKQLSQEQVIQAIKNLTKATPEPLVKFLYIILDKLLDLMVNAHTAHVIIPELPAVCFEMLGQIVKILSKLLDEFTDQHSRSSLFTTYIQFHRVASEVGNFTGLESSVKQSPSDTRQLLDIIKGFEKYSSHKTTMPEISAGNLGKTLHEELLKQVVCSEGACKETAVTNAWFFMELLIKSMAEYLHSTNRLYLPRKIRFGDEFVDNFAALVTFMTQQVIDRASRTMQVAQEINNSLAFFIRDALSLMDRTFVMGQIRYYCKTMANFVTGSGDLPGAMTLKMDFIRIVCSHEHYILLNLPLISSQYMGLHRPTPPSPSPSASSCNSLAAYSTSSANTIGASELTHEFRTKHFLVGIVLSDLASVLEMSYSSLHARAICIVRNLLISHDMDERLTDVSLKKRVSLLYIPLLGIVLDACTQLYDPHSKKTNAQQEGDVVLFDGHDGPGLNPKIAMAISGVNPPLQGTQGGTGVQPGRTVLSLHSTRHLLACFCWVLKNVDTPVLTNWCKELSPRRITVLIDVLQLCVSCYEYKTLSTTNIQKTELLKHKLEQAILGKSSNASQLRERGNRNSASIDRVDSFNETSSTITSATTNVRWRKDVIEHKMSSTSQDVQDNEIEPDECSVIEGNLCTEICLVVLDTLEMIIDIFTNDDTSSVAVLPLVLRVLLHSVSLEQSVVSMHNLFNTQRAILAKFPELLLQEEIEQCAELCLQLLRHCAGSLSPIRAESAASLYLLMRHSFESPYSFSRVKMQMTVALSNLVSCSFNGMASFREAYLRASLKNVLTYAELDTASDIQLAETSFLDQVKDLVFNLNMILSDTVKMNEFANDFDMIIDLMYRIAKGYQNNADLRVAWLHNIGVKQLDRGNYAEAAMCALHQAALVAEYMHMIDDVPEHPCGAVSFVCLSANALEESAVSDDVISPNDGLMCHTKYFSEDGLLSLLEQSADCMYHAQMYETMHKLYMHIIMPILEHNKDYAKMCQVHCRLHEAMLKIDPPLKQKHPSIDLITPIIQHDKRIFGTYFRVGFYGWAFGDLHGHEYVYKEPNITKLAEISHRLLHFYNERFDNVQVEVIKDSNKVDIERLDQDKAFLQITYVEPYFDKWELRHRSSPYDRSHNIKRFVYSTPYTLDGRAHGALCSQQKRKTVLTTSHAFPYIKTRIPIASKQVIDLAPIQVAIEDIEKKTRELSAATAPDPPDPKMLQMVLQGCIGTTVNQGPMEIANVFLSDLLDGSKPMDRHQNKLRLCFKDFSKKCADALRENKRLVGSDQREYQRELERNYVHFTEKLAPMICTGRNINLANESRV